MCPHPVLGLPAGGGAAHRPEGAGGRLFQAGQWFAEGPWVHGASSVHADPAREGRQRWGGSGTGRQRSFRTRWWTAPRSRPPCGPRLVAGGREVQGCTREAALPGPPPPGPGPEPLGEQRGPLTGVSASPSKRFARGSRLTGSEAVTPESESVYLGAPLPRLPTGPAAPHTPSTDRSSSTWIIHEALY